MGFAQSSMRTTPSGTATGLSFRFTVPDHLPESDVEPSGAYHFWRITLRADFPGVKLDREYRIPVFQTNHRPSSIQHDLSQQAGEARAKAADVSRMALSAGRLHQTALARSVRFSERGGVSHFYYPMFRNKALTLFALFFEAGFCFATCWMVTE